ncbi:MAG: ATP-binding cassette domain-containing protein [Candidatus Marinimicrobia bacterium]|jgi:ABC-type multidrug transport system ATPase subunit|nr:ATP-binding cassette domain-containing protein [Candidatus Neomarinimicrobiota bacterium]MBT3944104.1 ATP-binding cassette domain-containing protein [Candidatus Neomarinimicrobiota bacterium]MBT4112105.1 ATP-binding cassette domain-containing protein [Candidatus Neomarinimicrobiota bacterium]MBT4317020.1 ATP-binding cassette domain-containing protein [Candidatus Neomarinimicrobiota bacterium]MBT4706640.1 ATP-binding cassette domain-containing protein [Candidatus Neomarinimicrobiota bacterium
MELKQIYDISGLKLKFGSKKALEINTLKFHNGLIYGVCGNFGSGKSSLMKVLSGLQKESKGDVLYQGSPFKTSFFGNIKKHKEIQYIHVDMFNDFSSYLKRNSTVEQFLKGMFSAKINQIRTRHFKHFSLEHLWKTPINKLSDGEKHWLKIVVGVEKDPRVLIVDDYGLHLDPKNEMILRKKIMKMNNILGTTIILSSTSDYFVKQFANVVIYLDNGHVSKVRKGYKRNSFNKHKSKK